MVCGNVPTLIHLEAAMSITTLTSRAFNQDASKAKKAAQSGPVIITDRGRPAHVLLTFNEYKQLIGQPTPIAELLAMPQAQDTDFEQPARRELARAADFN
jgi:prevent-host-death family protein